MRLEQEKKKFVIGGKVWTHFNVRCPMCDKLYRIDGRDLASSEPHFDCRVCKTVFSFQNPPHNINKVQCRVISRPPPAEDVSVAQKNPSHFKKCPKCQALNPRTLEECQKCHVVFAKLNNENPSAAVDGSKSASTMVASVLSRAWKDIFRDYNNLSKHMAFVDQCDDLRALPFALKKYQELKEAQPQDRIVDEMIYKLKLKQMADSVEQTALIQKLGKIIGKANVPRIKKMFPWVGATAMIAVGAMSHSQRNFIGLGVAILFLWLGLKFFNKGKITLSDFY